MGNPGASKLRSSSPRRLLDLSDRAAPQPLARRRPAVREGAGDTRSSCWEPLAGSLLWVYVDIYG